MIAVQLMKLEALQRGSNMRGISRKTLAKVAIIPVLATGVAMLSSATEARTYHHHRGVPSAHRGGVVADTSPSYTPSPVYPTARSTGKRRYWNDFQLQGRTQ